MLHPCIIAGVLAQCLRHRHSSYRDLRPTLSYKVLIPTFLTGVFDTAHLLISVYDTFLTGVFAPLRHRHVGEPVIEIDDAGGNGKEQYAAADGLKIGWWRKSLNLLLDHADQKHGVGSN